MKADETQYPKNVTKRIVGVVFALLPLALTFSSMAVAITRPQHTHLVSITIIVAAALIAALNFYLSFIRGLLFSLRHGSLDAYRFVSGAPIIGTLLMVLGVALDFGAVGIALAGTVAYVLDTGSSLWFVIATWKDRSLWDA